MKVFFKNKKGKRAGLLVGIFLCLTLPGCETKMGEPLTRVDTAMGTIVSQKLYTEEKDSTLPKEIIELMEKLEKETLSWRLPDTEIAKINQKAGKGPIELQEPLEGWMDRSILFSKASDGAFDISVGALTSLWKIDTFSVELPKGDPRPGKDEVLEAEEKSGFQKIQREGKILFLPEGMQLDLGAVGKGIALDEIKALLDTREEVKGAVISAGGSILTYGEKPDHSPWKVGITDPFDTSKTMGFLQLNGQWCVSTSGDYERFYEYEGKRYHHLLDPRTGYPADSGVKSVTILTKNGMDSDALSTACFVLGKEKGMELAQEFDAEILIITKEGERFLSPGMEKVFHPAF